MNVKLVHYTVHFLARKDFSASYLLRTVSLQTIELSNNNKIKVVQ